MLAEPSIHCAVLELPPKPKILDRTLLWAWLCIQLLVNLLDGENENGVFQECSVLVPGVCSGLLRRQEFNLPWFSEDAQQE
jgi:hypothetical protein